MKRFAPFAIVALIGLLAVGAGAMLYRSKVSAKPVALTKPTEKQEKQDTSLGHVRGNPRASVTLEEFGDYQCPPCGKLALPIKALEHQYGDRLCMVFHHFPLVVHAHAREAAQAAEAAGRQGKFWEMHDQLYLQQSVWSVSADPRANFARYATELGLNAEQFTKDMDSETVKERIEADISEAKKLGVDATPTIFINNQAVPMSKGDPVPFMHEAIESALKPAPSS
jgi:protein-disulfide isomerase